MNHHLTGRQGLKLSDTFNNRQPPNSIFHVITHVFRNCLPGQHFPKLLNVRLDMVPHDTGFQNTETHNNNTYNIKMAISSWNYDLIHRHVQWTVTNIAPATNASQLDRCRETRLAVQRGKPESLWPTRPVYHPVTRQRTLCVCRLLICQLWLV